MELHVPESKFQKLLKVTPPSKISIAGIKVAPNPSFFIMHFRFGLLYSYIYTPSYLTLYGIFIFFSHIVSFPLNFLGQQSWYHLKFTSNDLESVSFAVILCLVHVIFWWCQLWQCLTHCISSAGLDLEQIRAQNKEDRVSVQ